MNIMTDDGVRMLSTLKDTIDFSHYWTLDLAVKDYSLTPIKVLEQIEVPTMVCQLGSQALVELPVSWSVLVCDKESAQVDVLSLAEFGGRAFNVMIFGPNKTFASQLVLRMVEYKAKSHQIYPSILKHNMLCIPISETQWMHAGPPHNYSRLLKNTMIGDIIN